MINIENKNIYFAGRGEKVEKDELITYLSQHNCTIIDNLNSADLIIEGYLTPPNISDDIYMRSKDGIPLYTIEQIEKEFSSTIDVDSIIISIKISKDQDRLIKLLNNQYLSDDTFIKLLKFYNWCEDGIYDSDENRDVATSITLRFCSLTKTNHNIQHSPVGIYYTTLEATNSKLLEVIYHMPHFSISDKNAKENQPLTLKETVALNPNISKPLQMQIYSNAKHQELKFLASNKNLSPIMIKKLISLEDEVIIQALIQSSHLDLEQTKLLFPNKQFQKDILLYSDLEDDIFEYFCSLNLETVEIIVLSQNDTLKADQIGTLFSFDVENANINLLKHPNCDIKQIEQFLKRDDKVYNIAIAHNTNLNNMIFKALLNKADLDINITLAYNLKTPKDIIKSLYEKNDYMINSALSTNEATPINILMQLQLDNRLTTNVSNNETYRAFSRKSLGIINEFN